uniref:Uncharacterized protein n=1 Tax=Arundo donax TaxID=35708 RepID=A0A0A9BJH2_ARUDO
MLSTDQYSQCLLEFRPSSSAFPVSWHCMLDWSSETRCNAAAVTV